MPWNDKALSESVQENAKNRENTAVGVDLTL